MLSYIGLDYSVTGNRILFCYPRALYRGVSVFFLLPPPEPTSTQRAAARIHRHPARRWLYPPPPRAPPPIPLLPACLPSPTPAPNLPPADDPPPSTSVLPSPSVARIPPWLSTVRHRTRRHAHQCTTTPTPPWPAAEIQG